MVNRKNDYQKIRLTMFMVRFLVYINNKLKTDDRFTFSGTVRLIEPCPSLDSKATMDKYLKKI